MSTTKPGSIFLKNDTSANFGVDGSVTPVEFSIGPPAGFNQFVVHRFILFLEDGAGFRAEFFGGLGAALTNGCDFEFVDNGVTYDMLDGSPIKTNAHFGRISYDVELKAWGAGDDVLMARLSMDKFGPPVVLGPSQSFIFRVNDNLSALTNATICAQGQLIP